MLSQAVFLVGGRGTRLGALTAETPKPLLEVGGVPFLDYLIAEAARHGLRRVLLLTGYRHEAFERYRDGAPGGAEVTLVVEPEAAGTGGALRHAADLLDERFVLANGDTLFDINWLDLLTVPEPPGAVACMALKSTAEGGRYGTVQMTGARIGGFSAPEDGRPGPLNAGLYLMRRSILDWVGALPCSIEQEVFPPLAAAGRLAGRVYDRYFLDIGVPVDFARAQHEIPARRRRPAVFFDRDGVLNRNVGYAHRPDQIEWLPGARETVKLFNDLGYYVFVVTNQAGVARGFYDEATVRVLHDWMAAELQTIGAHVDAFEFCPHHPEGTVEVYARACRRRKPEPGMIEDCLAAWPVERHGSFLIGDNATDVEAAAAAGIAGHLFGGGDLLAFAQAILAPQPAEAV